MPRGACAQLIDEEARHIVSEAHARTATLLREKAGAVKAVAEYLLEKETITQHDLTRLLGERPFEIEVCVRRRCCCCCCRRRCCGVADACAGARGAQKGYKEYVKAGWSDIPPAAAAAAAATAVAARIVPPVMQDSMLSAVRDMR